MTSIWERFNEIEGADTNAVDEARSQFEPIGEGDYKVRLEGLVASESKSGLPMVKGRFRILEGERENSIIFYNQVIQNLNYPNITALNISKVMELVSGILGEPIGFIGLVELEELLDSIEEGIEFTLNVTYDAKDTEKSFPQLRVVEDIDDLDLGSDTEDVPY
ncbi:MAG TPA: DUF669 domain-containing protein [Tissierellaceae bacterium]|nr:DUF669 domain-containing protein [Tissierellaceae bacterium]